MIKLSIIVPVYNVEEYIKQCIDSLLSQTLDNIEIIIVNDGSTDNSINIIEQYDQAQIKLIHQDNKGLSGARNTGLTHAQGKYVIFIDSDDFIENKSAYEDMYNIAQQQNSDIVVGNALKYFNDENIIPLNPLFENSLLGPMTAEQFLMYALEKHLTFAPVVLYMFNREFLLNNNLFFKEGIYHEDEQFTPRVLLKASSISIYNETFYMYRQREGSIMNSTLNPKKGLDVLNTCSELEDLYNKLDNTGLKKALLNYISIVTYEQIYKYKFENVTFKQKYKIFKNLSNFSYKIRSTVLLLNTSIFLIFENKYRILRGIEK